MGQKGIIETREINSLVFFVSLLNVTITYYNIGGTRDGRKKLALVPVLCG